MEWFAEGSLKGEKVFDGKVFPRTYLPGDEAKAAASDLAALVTRERAALWEALDRHGALLFSGFRVETAGDFSAVVEAFGWEEMPLENPYGRTKKAHRVFTASEDPLDTFINFHHEMSLADKSCSKMFFYCQQPPPRDGQTSIVLSDVVAKQMERELPAVVNKLAEVGIRKVVRQSGRDHPAKVGDEAAADAVYGPMNPTREHGGRKVWWHAIYDFHGVDRSITVECGDGSPLPAALVGAYGRALEESCVDVNWRRGDVLLVDNLRVQHARRAAPPPRVVLVSVCK